VVALLLGAGAAILSLRLVEAEGSVGPGTVRLTANWRSGGDTVLAVPPLGRVVVDTHDTPIRVRAQVSSLDLNRLQDLAGSAEPFAQLQRDARLNLAPLVRELAWKSLVFAALAGLVVGALLPGRRGLGAAAGGLGGLLAVGGLLALTGHQFDTAAFGRPQFEGALERAPALLDAVEREIGDLAGVRDRVAYLSAQLEELLTVAAHPEGDALEEDVAILHVSDVHLNPLGLELARSLAEQFDVDAIVDTGDLTSFGLPVEQRIGELVSEMPVPYYLVPGNHDSFANRKALDEYPNMTVVDGEVVTIGGVRILGFADPLYTTEGGAPYERAREERARQADDVAAAVRRERPDVLAVAGLDQAVSSAGMVPLVISGDVHERSAAEEDGTLMLTVGSTGATGLGSFTVDTGRSYEAEILRFTKGVLVALDYVTLDGVTGSFTVNRVRYPVPDWPPGENGGLHFGRGA
jgi:predicted phosphodiesterase